MKMEMHKNIYGLHSVVRREFERKELTKVKENERFLLIIIIIIIRRPFQTQTRLPVLGSSNLAAEVLTGRLDSIEFEDYLNHPSLSPAILDVHGTAEVHRLGWNRPV